MRTVQLPNGTTMPAMGQGTWFLGDNPQRRAQEIAALRVGVECGLTLIDTAEMYGGGRSEDLVGEAISGCRDDVFLVSKVLPGSNRAETIEACEKSLERLGTDHLDLYLLHGVGPAPFEETLEGFEHLVAAGKIDQFGVSNLDLEEMQYFHSLPGGGHTQVQQLLYNLNQRGIEWDLLPWLQRKGLGMMAYSPFDRGDLAHHAGLTGFARERGATAGQVALAWLLAQDQVIPIPKSSQVERVTENAGALELELTTEDLAALDDLFAPPNGPESLQIY